eukprot:5544661-Prymnesium_polylepis.1
MAPPALNVDLRASLQGERGGREAARQVVGAVPLARDPPRLAPRQRGEAGGVLGVGALVDRVEARGEDG